MPLRPWELANLARLATNLARALGDACEIVVHDLSDLDHSVVFIAGNVTGRQIGSPMTNMGLQALRQGKELSDDFASYHSELPDGRVLKSSSTFFHDQHGRPTAAVCVNIDLTRWIQAADLLARFVQPADGHDMDETYLPSVPEVVGGMVSDTLHGISAAPTAMDAAQRLEVMRALERRGVFLMRGSLGYVARLLGVSRATAYTYLQRIRSEESFPVPSSES